MLLVSLSPQTLDGRHKVYLAFEELLIAQLACTHIILICLALIVLSITPFILAGLNVSVFEGAPSPLGFLLLLLEIVIRYVALLMVVCLGMLAISGLLGHHLLIKTGLGEHGFLLGHNLWELCFPLCHLLRVLIRHNIVSQILLAPP